MTSLWSRPAVAVLACGVTIFMSMADSSVSSVRAAGPPHLAPRLAARSVKWDYYLHPVSVTTSSDPEPGRWVRWAFDGYPTNVSQPHAREHWRTAAPKSEKPVVLTLDYGRALAVTRFVHYYEGVRPPAAWKDVEILSSTDSQSWIPLAAFADLRPDYPQVLAIDNPVRARYYRFVIRSLADGAANIATQEIETYYGTTVGGITPSDAVQSEPFDLKVRVTSTDAPLSGASLRLVAPKDSIAGTIEIPIPRILKGGSFDASFRLTPISVGPLPMIVELRVNGLLIDSRPFTMTIKPKLEIGNLAPGEAVVASSGRQVSVKGTLRNAGKTAVSRVKVTWMGRSRSLGSLEPGESASFEITAAAKPGYSEGLLVAAGLAAETPRMSLPPHANAGPAKNKRHTPPAVQPKSILRRPVLCAAAEAVSLGESRLNPKNGPVKFLLNPGGSRTGATGVLQVLASDRLCPLLAVGPARLAADVPGGVFLVDVVDRKDVQAVELKCSVVPNDPNPVDPPWLDLEVRLGVDKPRVMFRPHIDWYTAEHGPNVPDLLNGHHSATRMICIQTTDSALSMVPDTDTMKWGFTKDNQMTAQFQIALAPHDPLNQHVWRAIDYAPTRFSLLLPVVAGDWWDAYRHVVKRVFKFEQPRQWAMPLTQMQMLNARYILRHEVWSEKWQTVRSFPYTEFFFNFYGTTYTLPALYSWYLATDLAEAKLKAEKVLEWLLSLQEKEGFTAGAWFSQYADEAGQLVGRDQAGNRWIVPHSTGSAAKTLLWYWNATGRADDRAFQAAKRACDWLISTQNPDGAWPYAFDLGGKPVTDLSDAGQIWCTWALWQMGQYSGESKYTQAALRSKEAFKKNFVDVHRYMGYWEDVSGGAGKVTRSWEGYEPAIACLVFTEMGDSELALACAKDAATWSWTRVISTRQYETCYGQTTEQSFCGPSQAQSPMVGVGLHQIYENTGDELWSDLSGAVKAVNFCADPDQLYGMCATTGWVDPTRAVAGPPFDNVRPWITPANSRGDEYGRGVWAEWETSQFAWLALEWLIREANVRAPQFVKIDPSTLRGAVLGEPGRIKMPEERCDVNGIDHYDINWVGCANDHNYVLLVMNHKERTRVAVRPHEAHLDVYTRPPRVLVGNRRTYREVRPTKNGVQYVVDIPADASALLVWDRIK